LTFSYPQSIARRDTANRQFATYGRGTGYNLALGGGSLSQRLDQAGVAGLITSRPKDQIGTMEIFETYSTVVPTIALSCEDYGLVYRLAQNNQHPKLRINLDAKLLGEQPVFNTVATIPGGTKATSTSPVGALRLVGRVLRGDRQRNGHDHDARGDEDSQTSASASAAHDRRGTLDGRRGRRGRLESLLRGSSGDRERAAGVVQSGQRHGPHRARRRGRPAERRPAFDGWLSKVPNVFQQQVGFTGQPVPIGGPAGGGSDDFSFSCYGAPTFGLGALGWDYNSVTWHTERDTYDKVVFDDLKSNATLTAMLVYLASEDPGRVTPINADSARRAVQPLLDSIAAANGGAAGGGRGAGRGGGGRGGGGPRLWPKCEKAPRVTQPRLR
jgi:hypothetical protein